MKIRLTCLLAVMFLAPVAMVSAGGTIGIVTPFLGYESTTVNSVGNATYKAQSASYPNYTRFEWAAYEFDGLYYRTASSIFRLALDGLLTNFKYTYPSYAKGMLFDFEMGYLTGFGLGIGLNLHDIAASGPVAKEQLIGGTYINGVIRYLLPLDFLIVNSSLALGYGGANDNGIYEQLKVEGILPLFNGLGVAAHVSQEIYDKHYNSWAFGVDVAFVYK